MVCGGFEKNSSINRRKVMKGVASGIGIGLLGRIATPQSGTALAAPICDGGCNGKQKTAQNTVSTDYVLNSNARITFTTRIHHLGSAHYDDGTYGHKFSLNSQGVCVDKKRGGKSGNIQSHSVILNATNQKHPPTFFIPKNQPELSGYPDSSLFGNKDAEKLFGNAIKIVAGALKNSVGIAINAATIVEGLINAVANYDDRGDFLQFGWGYDTASPTDIAHQAKLFASHPDSQVPSFDVKTQAANSAFHKFGIALGGTGGVSTKSSVSVEKKSPIPRPQSMTGDEIKRYGVREVSPERAPTKPGTSSVKATHLIDEFPIEMSPKPVHLNKEKLASRERNNRYMV